MYVKGIYKLAKTAQLTIKNEIPRKKKFPVIVLLLDSILNGG